MDNQNNTIETTSKNNPTKILVSVVILAAIIGFFTYLVMTNRYNGTYELTEITYNGQTFTDDATVKNITLVVKGHSCKFNNEQVKFKIKGTKVTITDSKSSYHGTYSKSDKTISIDIDGKHLVFKKK